MNQESLDRAEQAAAMIDPRLSDLWMTLWTADRECVGVDAVAGLLRLAYLSGYSDALSESERGALLRKLGIRVPEPSKPGATSRRRRA